MPIKSSPERQGIFGCNAELAGERPDRLYGDPFIVHPPAALFLAAFLAAHFTPTFEHRPPGMPRWPTPAVAKKTIAFVCRTASFHGSSPTDRRGRWTDAANRLSKHSATPKVIVVTARLPNAD